MKMTLQQAINSFNESRNESIGSDKDIPWVYYKGWWMQRGRSGDAHANFPSLEQRQFLFAVSKSSFKNALQNRNIDVGLLINAMNWYFLPNREVIFYKTTTHSKNAFWACGDYHIHMYDAKCVCNKLREWKGCGHIKRNDMAAKYVQAESRGEYSLGGPANERDIPLEVQTLRRFIAGFVTQNGGYGDFVLVLSVFFNKFDETSAGFL